MKPRVVLAGVTVIEIVMAAVLFPLIDHAHIATTDFVNFYAAATIVRDGHGSTLYTAETQQQALQTILGYRTAEYFLHPAFEAVVFVPLTYLRIERAFVLWTLINVAFLGFLPLVLAGYVPLVARRPYLGLLGFAFPPVLAGLTLGQDSILVMFVISAAYLLLVRRQDLLGGAVLALAMVKFQYALILALLFLISRRFRLISGFVLGCVLLALASILVTGVGGAMQYVRFLHHFEQHVSYGAHSSDQMVMTFSALLAGLGWTPRLRLYELLGSTLFLALGVFIAASRRRGHLPLSFALFLAIALIATPYDHFQDVAILLPGIFLAMDDAVSQQMIGIRTKLVAASCVLLFVWPAVLVLCGGHYFWNSRIYLVFPVILLFVGTLAAQLWSGGMSNGSGQAAIRS